jgi:hypothetical protein
MESVNFLAVLVGGIAYMILGALWYSPILFGKAWMRGSGKTEEQVRAGFKYTSYLWAFVGSLLAAYGIARILVMFDASTLAQALKLAVVCGVCFVGAAFFVNDTFDRRPRGLTTINALYHLVGLIVIALIVGAWR